MKIQEAVLRSKANRLHLGFLILECEVLVAGSWSDKVGDFTLYPDIPKLGFQLNLDTVNDLGHGEDLTVLEQFEFLLLHCCVTRRPIDGEDDRPEP